MKITVQESLPLRVAHFLRIYAYIYKLIFYVLHDIL